MIYREIFPDTEPARDYAVRMSKSDAQPYEFDLLDTEVDALQKGQTIVLVVGHDQADTVAVVLTRKTDKTEATKSSA